MIHLIRFRNVDSVGTVAMEDEEALLLVLAVSE